MNIHEYNVMAQHEDSHWWYKTLREISYQEIKNITLDKNKPIMILDAGCGTGGLSRYLETKNIFGTIYGFDIHKKAIWFSKNKNSSSLSVGDINAIPFQSHSFDIVISNDVLYHKKVSLIKSVLEIERVLKPGGYLVINLPAFACLKSAHDTNVHTARRFSKKEIQLMFHKNKWKLLKQYYWNILIFPFIFGFRIFQNLNFLKIQNISEVQLTNKFINKILHKILVIERILPKICWNFPGLSILTVLQKRTNF